MFLFPPPLKGDLCGSSARILSDYLRDLRPLRALRAMWTLLEAEPPIEREGSYTLFLTKELQSYQLLPKRPALLLLARVDALTVFAR